MDTLIEGLSHIDAGTFILWIIAILGLIGGVVASIKKIYILFEKYRRFRNNVEETNKTITKHEDSIIKLDKEMTILNEKIDVIIDQMNKSEEAAKKYRMTSLHDRLFQLHRVVMEHGYISEDDLENFNKMTSEYLSNNGNGIVKKKIIPEVLALPIKYEEKNN